uniref:Uncharacterized protein n=1 Tax=Anopheles coluzzii TaxID=1518534 RepID=A0A8W7PV90_ANOCL
MTANRTVPLVVPIILREELPIADGGSSLVLVLILLLLLGMLAHSTRTTYTHVRTPQLYKSNYSNRARILLECWYCPMASVPYAVIPLFPINTPDAHTFAHT